MRLGVEKRCFRSQIRVREIPTEVAPKELGCALQSLERGYRIFPRKWIPRQPVYLHYHRPDEFLASSSNGSSGAQL